MFCISDMGNCIWKLYLHCYQDYTTWGWAMKDWLWQPHHVVEITKYSHNDDKTEKKIVS